MANSESGSAGTKGPNHGDREQFDHFDRLSQVDQQDLNTDKMKATDKEADIEELLATEDKTNTTSSELHGGGYKTEDTDDWIEAISNGNNFVDSNPSNWLEDIDRESHEHSDPSDHSNEN